MKNFWIFRTNLTNLESYHEYNNLTDFENNLWDFYLVMGIWLLRSNNCEKVTVWRLTKTPIPDLIFSMYYVKKNGKEIKKKLIQKFVKNFDECFNYDKPDMTFFRGGFFQYGELTKKNPDFFGTKLYLGASVRRYPIYGGKYDKILVESENDMKRNTIPFYKIGPPKIFHPLDLSKEVDICWPCNFTQQQYKGQDYFIEQVSKSKSLKKLRIVHIGNKSEIGKRLCRKYGVNNIEFFGRVDRNGVNKVLNMSKFGLVTSNVRDGCPRVSTEILASGTPLLIRKQTRLLDYYKKLDYVKVFDDDKFKHVYKEANSEYEELRQKNLEGLENELCLDNIMEMNIQLWK